MFTMTVPSEVFESNTFFSSMKKRKVEMKGKLAVREAADILRSVVLTEEQAISACLEMAETSTRAAVSSAVSEFLNGNLEGVDIDSGILNVVDITLNAFKEGVLSDEAVANRIKEYNALARKLDDIYYRIRGEYEKTSAQDVVIRTPVSIDPETPSSAIGIRKDGEFHAVPESALPEASKSEGGLSQEAIARLEAFNKK